MTRVLLITDRQIQLESVNFAFRPNFEGRPEKFNREGDRYFNVRIDDQETADRLVDAGLNVKFYDPMKNPKNEERDPEMLDSFWFFKVPVYYRFYPPTVSLVHVDNELDEAIDNDDKTFLDESTVGMIDTMEYKNIDMVITLRDPAENGTYVRTSLKAAYVTVEPSPLARRYGY